MKLRLELQSHGGNTAGFVIPPEVVDELGAGRRPQVVVTVGQNTWRTSIASMGGQFLLGMSQENRAAAGVAAGQTLDVTVEVDDAPRDVEPPEDLALALAADQALSVAWGSWPPGRQKEAARQLTDAKKPETRARRLGKILVDLAG